MCHCVQSAGGVPGIQDTLLLYKDTQPLSLFHRNNELGGVAGEGNGSKNTPIPDSILNSKRYCFCHICAI